jgi:uncharacterized membrane protein HdeD (DUF308 family)
VTAWERRIRQSSTPYSREATGGRALAWTGADRLRAYDPAGSQRERQEDLVESSVSREGESLGDMSIGRLWWLWLVTGVAWILIALVILQFDDASVTTVGVLIGIMFLLSGVQQFVVAAVAPALRWLWIIFGILFVIAGIIALISPENTFAAIADILGFLFLLVGLFWVIQAFVDRDINELWWLGLIAGVLMIILAFWTGGQFFITKSYVLLVFAGIWALMHGVTDIIRAFQIRKLR